jgi:hypothetical protein
MADKKFDPTKFIDRTFEQGLFEDLLQFKDSDNTRILAICDKGGMGKTQLLRKLEYRCRTVKPRMPVSLIDLEELRDNNPLTLVKKAVQDLVPFGLALPNFLKYDIARRSGDFSPILSSIYLEGAYLRAGSIKMAGSMANVEGNETVNLNITSTGIGTLNPEQQAIADEVCIRAFFDDLKEHCRERAVVLLFDAYDKCGETLKEWILHTLLATHFFDLNKRPARLVLVVAGREKPEFEMNWVREDIEAVVKSRQLGKWEKGDVEECLKVNRFIYEANQLELFWTMIQEGLPPSFVFDAMQSILRREM